MGIVHIVQCTYVVLVSCSTRSLVSLSVGYGLLSLVRYFDRQWSTLPLYTSLCLLCCWLIQWYKRHVLMRSLLFESSLYSVQSVLDDSSLCLRDYSSGTVSPLYSVQLLCARSNIKIFTMSLNYHQSSAHNPVTPTSAIFVHDTKRVSRPRSVGLCLPHCLQQAYIYAMLDVEAKQQIHTPKVAFIHVSSSVALLALGSMSPR